VAATNWARNVAFDAASYEQPTSTDEVRAVVGRADQVRVLGSGHSFNRIADTSGVQLSLAALRPSVDIDAAARQVRISAGLTYAAIAPQLQAAGLALPNLASLPHITVAGACATGTHGSGDGNGGLASAVAGIELVVANGDVVTIRRGDPGFDGAVVSLGRLGVITALTLDLVPSYDISQYVYDSLPDESLDADFDAIFATSYSVSVFCDFDEHNRMWCKQLATDPPPGPILFDALASLEPRNPVPGMSPDNTTQQLGIPGPWHERLPHFRAEFAPSWGDELQSEYLLPREHAVAALRALRAVRDRFTAVLKIAEIRTIAADAQWLSPMYGRDTVGFHFTWTAEAPDEIIETVEQALAPFEPRPHWAKVFSQAAHYERMPDFAELVRRYDPGAKFGNDFVDGLIA
jgi:xylitol oxidase